MKIDKARIITTDTISYLHVDIVKHYSVIYISPFTNDNIKYIYICK